MSTSLLGEIQNQAPADALLGSNGRLPHTYETKLNLKTAVLCGYRKYFCGAFGSMCLGLNIPAVLSSNYTVFKSVHWLSAQLLLKAEIETDK